MHRSTRRDAALLGFVLRYLDNKAKLAMEDPATRLPPDHAFTRLQLRFLASDVRDAVLRDQAARALALKHLDEFGVTASESVAREFEAVCRSAPLRRQVLRAYASERRRFRDHDVRVFRRDEVDLNLHVFRPTIGGRRSCPGILLLFGGGWYDGKSEQFFSFGQRFARLGYVAMVADYRTKGRNNVPPSEGLKDAKSAIRYARQHAGELGLDPRRLCVAGWSAGGHLAIATAAITAFHHADDDLSVSCRPDAVIMIAPGLDVATQDWFAYVNGGAAPAQLCPFRHVRKGLPPTFTLVGDHDACIGLSVVQRFTDKMRRAGVICRLDVARGVPHAGHFTSGTCRKFHGFLAKHLAAPRRPRLPSLTTRSQMGFSR